MAERAAATPLEFKRSITRALCWAVKEPTLEALEDHAARHGLKVVQAWKAPRGEGFKAAAARLIYDGDEVLIVAFRATFGNDEWLEYPQKYWKQRFMPHDGEVLLDNFGIFLSLADADFPDLSFCTVYPAGLAGGLTREFSTRVCLAVGPAFRHPLTLSPCVCFCVTEGACARSCVRHFHVLTPVPGASFSPVSITPLLLSPSVCERRGGSRHQPQGLQRVEHNPG